MAATEKAKYGGVTDIMRASVSKDVTVLMQMLCTRPNVAQELLQRDEKGRTALDWARINRNYLAVTLILKVISKFIYDSRIERTEAVRDFEKFVVRTNKQQSLRLLKALKDRNTTAALEIITLNELVRSDIERFGDIFFTDRPGAVGYTPLMLAAGLAMGDVVRALVERDAPINQANSFGHSALTISVCAGNSDIVQYLLFKGANLYHATTDGRTALHYACLYKKAKIVKILFGYLLEKFSDHRIEGHSLIAFDSRRWTTYVDKLGALINLRDVMGWTARELLGEKSPEGLANEARLRVSGGRGISMLHHLNLRPEDLESTTTNFSSNSRSVSATPDKTASVAAQALEGIAAATDEDDGDDELLSLGEDASDAISEVTLQSASDVGGQRADREAPGLHPITLAAPQAQHDYDEVVNRDLGDDGQEGSAHASMQWSHDTDNQHAERADLGELFSVKTSMPHAEEVERILIMHKRILDRMDEWMDRAQKEDALVQRVPCLLGCGEMIVQEAMQDHVRDHCALRTVQCHQCHQIVIMQGINEHLRRQCMQRTIACPHAYQGCTSMLTPDQVDFHLRLQCNYRLVLCKQYCHMFLPLKYVEVHEQDHCKNRIIKCDQCKSPMQAHEYRDHVANQCQLRQVKCSVGCGVSLAAKDVKHHEEVVCCQPCKYRSRGCTVRMGPPAKLALHEAADCPLRSATCRHKCAQYCMVTGGLRKRDQQYHESFLCRAVPQSCPRGCGAVFSLEQAHQHADRECSERLVRCPSNYVGWRVWVNTGSIHRGQGLVLRYQRKDSEAPGVHPRDELYVRFDDGHDWVDLYTSEVILMEKAMHISPNATRDSHIDAHFDCGWVSLADLQSHLMYLCAHRIVHLTVQQPSVETVQVVPFTHAVAAAATLDSLTDAVALMSSDMHTQPCECCGFIYPVAAMERHQAEDCAEALLLCPIGCGRMVKRKAVQVHVSDECRKRVVVCPQCQRDDLWAEELDEHMLRTCSHRIIQCRNECGCTTLWAQDEAHHLNHTCPLRPVQCDCGLYVPAKDMTTHKLLQCNERVIQCPQGCGATITFNQRDNHINFDCSQRHLFRFSERVECPNGCGAGMLRRELLEHVSYQCEKRTIECPQLCGNSVQLDRLSGHLVVCPQRQLCCEPGMKTCSNALFKWFYKGDLSLDAGAGAGAGAGVGAQPQLAAVAAAAASVAQVGQNASQVSGSLFSSVVGGNAPAKPIGIAVGEAQRNNIDVFEGNDIHIGLTNARDANFFGKIRISHAAHVDESHSRSSIYKDGAAMKFRENLRMVTCERHQMNALMAAIRNNDEQLLEFIAKQVQESADIDEENIYGDTALTLACRLGRMRCVELLVQHGADLNKETFNGRTALIEAIKCPIEHLAMVEYLLKEGCMVAYKTTKHGRTALDWARRYNASEIQLYEERRRRQMRAKRMREEDVAAEAKAARKEARGGISSDSEQEDDELTSRSSGSGSEDSFSDSEHSSELGMPMRLTEEEKPDPGAIEVMMELTEEQKRLMGRPRTVRILELAFLVQQQCNIMFQKIAIGDNDYIINIVKDGDFFDVRNEEKAYKHMGEHTEKSLDTDRDIIQLQTKMHGLSDKIDTAHEKYQDMVRQLRQAEERVEIAASIEREVDNGINRHFATFEKIAAKLTAVDVEEIHRVHKPPPLLLVAMFACGVVFGLFSRGTKVTAAISDDQSEVSDTLSASVPAPTLSLLAQSTVSMSMSTMNSFDPSALAMTFDEIERTRGDWLSWIRKQLERSQDSLRLLQTFSRAKLHLDRHQALFVQAKNLLDTFARLLNVDDILTWDGIFESMASVPSAPSDEGDSSRETSTAASPMTSPKKSRGKRKKSVSHSPSPTRSVSSVDALPTSPGKPTATFASPSKPATASTMDPLPEDSMAFSMASFASQSGPVQSEDPIPDYEWDSDAEDPEGGGYWSKGEWVAQPRKRKDWWNRTKPQETSTQSSLAPSATFSSGKLDRSHLLSNKALASSSTFVLLSDELIEQEKKKTLREISGNAALATIHGATGEEIMEEDFLNNTINPIVDKPLNAPLVTSLLGSPGSRSRSRSPKSRSRSRSPSRRRSMSSQPSSKSRGRSKSRRDSGLASMDSRYETMAIDVDTDVNAGAPFINSVLHLLKAIHIYGTDTPVFNEKKTITLQCVVVVDEVKARLQAALDAYNAEYAVRASLEQGYIKLLKKTRFHRDKVTLYTNKVRICRLLNYVCVNGHTAVSYAASYGNYALVEELLSRGATVGYTAEMIIQVVRFLQASYRIYRLTLKARANLKRANDEKQRDKMRAMATRAREEAVEDENASMVKAAAQEVVDDHIDPLQVFAASKAGYISIIREIEEMKERRKKIMTVMVFNRHKMRLPVPEALYMGHWEIVQRIWDRKLWHMYFTHTFAFPLPHPPYLRQMEYLYSHTKLSVQDVMTHAMDRISSGVYSGEEGWLPPGHVREPFGEMLQEMGQILATVNERNTRAVAAKQRLRLINQSKINMKIYEQQLTQLIYSRSFKKAMELIISRGLNVDLETPDGQTLLTAAAEENIHAVNHTRILNAELTPVLTVEFLLDRYTFRPNLNYETRVGLTALFRACILGREDIVVALLNRGAKINHVNKHRKTVLHYATMYGHAHIVRLLLERQADVQVCDGEGKTAYQVAEELNFVDIMTVLSQYASGNLGALAYTRGQITNLLSCPLGCGMRLLHHMKAVHVADECECRCVPCPNGCDDPTVMFKELAFHTEVHCARRLVSCEACQEPVVRADMQLHLRDHCAHRLVGCPNQGCDKTVLFKDLELHLRICPYKLIPCPLMCDAFVQEVQRDAHVAEVCPNRRVPCPFKCRNFIIFKFLDEHMTNVCSYRTITCPLCGAEVQKRLLEYHVNNDCGQRDLPCPNKCGVLIKSQAISQHLTAECERRYVECPLRCGLQLEARHLPAHMDHQCAERLVPCKFVCVQSEELPEDKQIVNRFPHKLVRFHELYDCPNRLVRCHLCEDPRLVHKKRLVHELFECPKRIVLCANSAVGCTKQMPWDKMDHHCATACKYRDVVCPLGCGRHIRYSEKMTHVHHECEQRYIECPLGCKEQVKLVSVMDHIAHDCLRRHVTQVCYGGGLERSHSAPGLPPPLSPQSTDLNALLSSMTVTEVPQDSGKLDRKLLARREETLRVQQVRQELRLSDSLRAKLVAAISSSAGVAPVSSIDPDDSL